jgi:hypothetical protein
VGAKSRIFIFAETYFEKTSKMKDKTSLSAQRRKKRKPSESEPNQYDKIFKEVLRRGTPTLLTEILKVASGKYQPIHPDLQRTIEKKADFLGKLFAVGDAQKIVHLEVQATDDSDMIFRELLYLALILVNYPTWQVEQIVFAIGKERPKMPTFLKRENLDFKFRLIWIKDISYREFLKTGKPEIMLFGILAGFEQKNAQEVMTEIVNEVRRTAKSQLDFERHTEQLHILSHLHTLQEIFRAVMVNISKLIDETQDPFFQRGEVIGIEKGIEKGIEQGIEKGLSAKTLEIIINLITQSDLPDGLIASIAGSTQNTVEKMREIIVKNPLDYLQKLEEKGLYFSDVSNLSYPKNQ